MSDAFGGRGGIAQYNRDLLEALCDQSDCEAVVAVPRIMPDLPGNLPAKLDYVTRGLNGKARYIRAVLGVVARKRPRFDLVICGHINLLPLAYPTSRWLGAPLVLFIYGVDAWKPPSSRVVRLLASRVDAVVSISEITGRRFLRWAPMDRARIFVLPNAIRPERFGPGPKPNHLLERYGLRGKSVLLTVGRLESAERRKGFDEVMELLPEISIEVPDVAYLIVGDGSDRGRLKEKAARLGVADRVVFAGYVSEEEKADHYRLADVYVMPSAGEGFGFVFLEAMACGIPVIGSKVDGSREALRDGRLGTLVDPHDAKECKKAIRSALTNTARAIPPGLDYFFLANYGTRLRSIIREAADVGRKTKPFAETITAKKAGCGCEAKAGSREGTER
jgi:glycosyltransferase involved in cell wall biosynthesis